MFEPLAIYDEYSRDHGYPSISEFISDARYENQDKIIDYLKHRGKVWASAAGMARDYIKNVSSHIPEELLDDGKYVWSNSLTYHVEKYNLRLPADVEKYILSKMA